MMIYPTWKFRTCWELQSYHCHKRTPTLIFRTINPIASPSLYNCQGSRHSSITLLQIRFMGARTSTLIHLKSLRSTKSVRVAAWTHYHPLKHLCSHSRSKVNSSSLTTKLYNTTVPLEPSLRGATSQADLRAKSSRNLVPQPRNM
jgi:hypothetical protein